MDQLTLIQLLLSVVIVIFVLAMIFLCEIYRLMKITKRNYDESVRLLNELKNDA